MPTSTVSTSPKSISGPGNKAILVVAILVILGWAATAHAEEPVAPVVPSPAPAGSRTLAETPFRLVLPHGHLFGDWAGARPWLEERGITPTLTFVMDALGNPTGGLQQGFRQASNLGVDLRFDLQKLFGLAGGSFEISFSERFGSSLSKEDIGNVFTVQQVFGGQTYRLVDVAYQQQLLDDRVEFRVGRIAAGDDFLVSPYNYVFVQNGFDGNPVGIFFNAPGMTAYPNATWGGLVKVRPTERMYVMGGLYNGDVSIRANEHHGADWSMDGPLFAIGEVGYQINGLPGDTGLSATTRLASGTTTINTSTSPRSRAAAPQMCPGGTGACMVYSTRCWCGSVGPAATVVSVLPARCSSLPINPSVSCRSSPPPVSSSAACSRRGRRTSAASALCTVTSAMTCKTRSGAPESRVRLSAYSATRWRSS